MQCGGESGVVWCGVVVRRGGEAWCGATWWCGGCGAMWCGVVRCTVLVRCLVRCGVVWAVVRDVVVAWW